MIYAKDYQLDKKIDGNDRLIEAIYIKGFPKSHRLCSYDNKAMCPILGKNILYKSWMLEEVSVYKREYINRLVPHSNKGSRYYINSEDYISRSFFNIRETIVKLESLSGLKSEYKHIRSLLALLHFGAIVFDNLISTKKLSIIFNDRHQKALDLINFGLYVDNDFTISFVLVYGYDGSSWEEYYQTKEKQIDIAFLKFFEWLYQITK